MVPLGRRSRRRQSDHGRVAPEGVEVPRRYRVDAARDIDQPHLPVAAGTVRQVPREVWRDPRANHGPDGTPADRSKSCQSGRLTANCPWPGRIADNAERVSVLRPVCAQKLCNRLGLQTGLEVLCGLRVAGRGTCCRAKQSASREPQPVPTSRCGSGQRLPIRHCVSQVPRL